MDALVDLTGGLAERYEIEPKDPNLYRQILRANKSEAFITCSRKVTKLSKCLHLNHNHGGIILHKIFNQISQKRN